MAASVTLQKLLSALASLFQEPKTGFPFDMEVPLRFHIFVGSQANDTENRAACELKTCRPEITLVFLTSQTARLVV